MVLKIGNTEYTNYLKDSSLTIRKYEAGKSAFEAELDWDDDRTALPLVGEEITVDQNGTRMWGGILTETEIQCCSDRKGRFLLRGKGYEQILERLCLASKTFSQVSPTEAVQSILSGIGSEEGISVQSIESSAEKKDYYFHPEKAASILDFLAEECGMVWWIDREKRFHMAKQYTESSAYIPIDLTGMTADCVPIESFTFRSSVEHYRNMQRTYNKTNRICGLARNIEKIQQMSNRYGSGSYGSASYSSLIQTTATANTLAATMLSTAADTDEIEFTTNDGRFDLGISVPVKAPMCGIKTVKNFRVSETKAMWRGGAFRYTVKLQIA